MEAGTLGVVVQWLRVVSQPLLIPSRFDTARAYEWLTVAAAGMAALTFGMLLIDARMIDGEQIWLKPFKFAVSFCILFATLGAVAVRLSRYWRMSWVLILSAIVSATAFIFEMAYIAAQAARAEHSHFNEQTQSNQVMYSLMGAGATALMVAIAVMAGAVLLDKRSRFGRGLQLGVIIGFVMTVVLTSWVAGELAGNGGRYIGVPGLNGARLPVLGWSMEVGDLRPAHFFALHSMQFLPAVGYLADRFQVSSRVIWLAALLYAIFTVMIFIKTQQSTPLISV